MNQVKNMDITKMSDLELRAVKGDTYEQLEIHNHNLQVIKAELEKRKEKRAFEAIEAMKKEKEEIKKEDEKRS
jgi:hypothetical protein